MIKSLILLMAGDSTRFNKTRNKALTLINNIPLFMYSLNKFVECGINEVIIVLKEDDEKEVKLYLENTPYNNIVKFVYGGAERFESVKEGLKVCTGDICLIHDAARPLVSKKDIRCVMESLVATKSSGLCKKIVDTVRRIFNKAESIDRNNLYTISTPQGFRKAAYDVILNNNNSITDELSLFNLEDVSYCIETAPNIKLTYPSDLELIKSLMLKDYDYFNGLSLDYHKYSDEGILVLGGLEFTEYHKLLAHSDGDVLIHSVCEALLGAASLGDLGTYFPDSDDKYKNISSLKLLEEVVSLLESKGYIIQNIDSMVYLEVPKLQNYKSKMASIIKDITHGDNVCVKAATLNKGGLISLNEGIGAETICLIKKRK